VVCVFCVCISGRRCSLSVCVVRVWFVSVLCVYGVCLLLIIVCMFCMFLSSDCVLFVCRLYVV